jgi:hypothetical protein
MDNGSYFGDGSTSPFDIIAYVGPLPPAAPAKEDVPFKIGDRVLVVSSDNIYCQRQAGQKGYVKKIRADGDLVSGHVVYVKTDNQDCLYYKVTDLKKLPTTITLGDDDVIQPGDMVVADNGATWKAMGSVGRTVKVAKAILGRGCQEITRTTNV